MITEKDLKKRISKRVFDLKRLDRMPEYFSGRFSILDKEQGIEIETTGEKCSLCNRLDGELALIPLKKYDIEKGVLPFFLRRCRVKFHKMKAGYIALCEKCHYIYHNDPCLDDFSRFEAICDYLFLLFYKKGVRKIVDLNTKWSKNIPLKAKFFIHKFGNEEKEYF